MEKLMRLTVLLKYMLDVETSDIRGVKDTPEKTMACYLAQKLSGEPDWRIAKYFQINEAYMNKLIETVSVQLLMDEKAKEEFVKLENMFKELERVSV
ncbi:MAG TPA: hypothetical protein VFM70_10660 [Salinimicrobium sp.]|nr:hypothetical protein [Salinimicrobium sp.]